MSENVVELYLHQEEFLFADEFITALIGGIGSGKTWSGAHYAIKKLQENPETMGFIGANTVKQLNDATLATLFEECDKFGILVLITLIPSNSSLVKNFLEYFFGMFP